jgi:DNA-directed RNA polymerase III subunit RPC2
MDRGFGRCLVIRKHQASIKRYNNGTFDRTSGPPDMNLFPGKEKDPR